MLSDEENQSYSNFDLSYSDPIVPKKRPYEEISIISQDEDDERRYKKGTTEYKKARKRRQNRESAIRSRHRKKHMETVMEKEIHELKARNWKLNDENEELRLENERLKAMLMNQDSTTNDNDFKNDIVCCPSGSVSPSWLLAGVLATIILVAFSAPGESKVVDAGGKKLLFFLSEEETA